MSNLFSGTKDRPMWFRAIITGLCTLLFLSTSLAVQAAQTNESQGPGGYGWQQVYEVFNAASGQATRITGTADRAMYDYGYKQIQVSGRKESYWSRDCGWWYVSAESTINITVWDAAGDVVYSATGLRTTKGRRTETLSWGSDDDPGEWTAKVDDGTTVAVFKFFVRGKLVVDSFLVTPTHPSKGENVIVETIIKDNSGNIINRSAQANNGTLTPINVTAYVSGSGEYFSFILVDDGTGLDSSADDGIWTGNFTSNSIGDHKIKVVASDGHAYWVDGSGSAYVSVGGSFPYALILSPFANYRGIEVEEGTWILSTLLATFGYLSLMTLWRRG